jgi:cytidyltransferase-like protein
MENPNLRIYTDAVMDLFHYGHVEFLRGVKELAGPKGTVVVGLHSDEGVASYKRTPILSLQERLPVVAACRYVDEVVPNAPLKPTKEYLENLGADLVVHGGHLREDIQDMMYGEALALGMYHEIEYTPGISTTDIIERVASKT